MNTRTSLDRRLDALDARVSEADARLRALQAQHDRALAEGADLLRLAAQAIARSAPEADAWDGAAEEREHRLRLARSVRRIHGDVSRAARIEPNRRRLFVRDPSRFATPEAIEAELEAALD